MKALKTPISLLLVIFLLVLLNCKKDRGITNPFDEGCPKELFTPSNFKAEQQNAAIKLSWTNSNTNINGFVINRSENAGTTTEVARIDKATTTWSDTKILGGTKYDYQLFAYAGANQSNSLTATITTAVLGATVTTVSAATNILPNSAVLGGNVTSDGGATVTERGICYGTTANPTIANSKVVIGNGTGIFSSTVTGLVANTIYYAKAYATNSYGTAYGSEITFTTSQLSLATVSTTDAASVGTTSVVLGGNVTNDGGVTVTERGICYSLTQNPTIANTKLAIGTGPGTFSNTITGLTAGTIYYAKAYAINSQGTAYGPQITFTTVALLQATVTTTAATSITAISAVLGGNITSDGGATVTERGICYSLTQNPTTANSKLAIGAGTGTFSNTLTGLTAGTVYYAKAYAINSIGTAYGTQITFTTVALLLATVTTTEATSITAISALLGGNVTSDGGATVTERGICYSLTQNPTTANSKLAIGTGTGAFSNTVSGLTAGTVYYAKAYAINSQGTVYGAQITFTTVALSLATVTTAEATSVTAISAILGGNVTIDGNATVTERGVCYGTVQNPTTSNSKLAIGTSTGTFSNLVSGLTAGTIYYAKAYAINSQGTAYGSQITFTTISLSFATVTTAEATSIGATSAILGGNVTNDGNGSVTERGVCYSLTQNPSTANTKLSIGTGTGTFNNTVSGLTANTTYYVKAYAINSKGTAYGDEVSFKTGVLVTLASLTTSVPTIITTSSAVLGGTINSDGNGTITERGICYGTTANPTTSNTKLTIGSGTGSFSGTITGLISNTTYYVRAYAINSQGTAYGNELNFKIATATLTTTAPANINSSSAFLGGEVTNDGNNIVTERGICYSTTQNPNISNTKIAVGNGIGTFSTKVTGLVANTTYYVRAYATNGIGTAYGNQVNFITLAFVSVPTLTTTAINNIAQTSATGGGNITADGGSDVTSRGICYSINQNPTLSDNFTVDGSGTGQFASQLTNLLPGTVYYVRAYATNSAGTGYGAQITFTTLKSLPIITTKNVTEISAMGGVTGGIITSTGGGTISAKGICWGELTNPTLSDNVISSGTGQSPFNSSIVSAVPGTTYYVRAYATNEVGTSYGEQKTFTTLSNATYYGFESGMLPAGWGGQWTVSSVKGFQSNYCLRSLPGVSSGATLTITLTNAGQISFYYFLDWGYRDYYGSQQNSIDFYIDAVKVGNFPASSGWNQGLFNVTAGVHIFKWQFNENYGGTGYIDYIVLPK